MSPAQWGEIACAEARARDALADRLRCERDARAAWHFRAMLAEARGEAIEPRPPRRTRAQERAAMLAADRRVAAAWVAAARARRA